MTARMSLLHWQPPCRVIAFPLINRVGRIREVARKMNSKSRAAASFYERQVTEGLLSHLERLGTEEAEQDRQIECFWVKVNLEIATLVHREAPRGDA